MSLRGNAAMALATAEAIAVTVGPGIGIGPVPGSAVGQAVHEAAPAVAEMVKADTEARTARERMGDETEGLDEPDYADVREAEDNGQDLTDYSDDGRDLAVDGPDMLGPDGDPGPGMGM